MSKTIQTEKAKGQEELIYIILGGKGEINGYTNIRQSNRDGKSIARAIRDHSTWTVYNGLLTEIMEMELEGSKKFPSLYPQEVAKALEVIREHAAKDFGDRDFQDEPDGPDAIC